MLFRIIIDKAINIQSSCFINPIVLLLYSITWIIARVLRSFQKINTVYSLVFMLSCYMYLFELF